MLPGKGAGEEEKAFSRQRKRQVKVLEVRERKATATRLGRERDWQHYFQKGLPGQVEKLDFLLRKGLVVSSISLACTENGWQGVGRGNPRQGELVGPELGQWEGG